MDISRITIEGDTPGVTWDLPVLTFRGKDPAAPSVYIQAALHAGELPGTALIHFLCDKLRKVEADGAILGRIVIVPQANPIGAAQWHFGAMQGRFDLGSRTNFNRDFPLIAASGREMLLTGFDQLSATDRLKRTLLHMALSTDLVLDLHCDEESLQYVYVDEVFWPEANDLAGALSMEAVFLADGESSAFDEAVSYAWKQDAPGGKRAHFSDRLAVTVELRGTMDVDPTLARRDAEGLMNFLIRRGVVSGEPSAMTQYTGGAAPLDNVEIIRALEPGTILFHRTIGEQVEDGDLLATIVTAPGMENGSVDIHAPQAGLIVTRTSERFAKRNGDLMKILCAGPTRRQRRPGALED